MWQAKAYTDLRTLELWLQHIFSPFIQGRRRLLILDSLKAHKSHFVSHWLAMRQQSLVIVPEVTTCFIQPADVGVIGPLRREFQGRYESEVTQRLVAAGNRGPSCFATC